MRAATVALFLGAMASSAPAMPVSTFLAEFESLDPAVSDSQLTTKLGELKAELQKDAAELRAERLKAVSAGKKPAYCPGPDGAQPSAEEIVAALEQVPEEKRVSVEVKDALRSYLALRYPC